MARDFRISVDLHQLLELGPLIRAAVFANLPDAVENIAASAAKRWQDAVDAAPLWQGERDAYAATIRYQMTGRFSAEIISDYKYVEDIESGRPAYDMKKMLNTSLKVRVSKTGRRYLIIPFRYNTPGSTALGPQMPVGVYQKAKKLKPSQIVGAGTRLSGTGAWDIKTRAPARVATRKYVWGGRLASAHGVRLPARQGPGVNGYTPKSDRFDGLVRFQTSSGKSKSSTYMTFRVMAEGSPGWVIPARPGLWIARAVAESIDRTAAADIGEAISRDLAA